MSNKDTLPPLPEPFGLFCGVRHSPPNTTEFWGMLTTRDTGGNKCNLYTEDQMRSYAAAFTLTAIAAQAPTAPPNGVPDHVFKAINLAATAVYLDDSSDFSGALWGVIEALSPELYEAMKDNPHAGYQSLPDICPPAHLPLPVQAEPPAPTRKNFHAHHVAVNKAALQMVRNALRNDLEQGKVVRGEMLEELDKATFAISAPAAQEPLTDEQVRKGANQYGGAAGEWLAFDAGVRLSEKHHGITGAAK